MFWDIMNVPFLVERGCMAIYKRPSFDCFVI